ncbi:MAG: PLP-dependent aspartate aminotransferase family protein [Mycoplasmataceae bacterium]|jgi:methionine-gamma-lyase|nr:PLP-dependent aspartate aminotransferase family protein [Mycoplasmataceae bacterium]
MKIATKIIRGKKLKNQFLPLTQPIYQTSTFSFDSIEEFKQVRYNIYHNNKGFNYSRISNPTNSALEKQIALLEGAEASVTTGSGMGAISTTLLTFLKKGDHIIFDNQIYDGTQYLADEGLPNFGIQTTSIDFNNLKLLEKTLRKNTKVVYFETPTNPKLKVNDIQAIVKLVRSFNKNIKIIIDGTITSPYLQKPIDLGVDIVIHSLTKYINGHGDVIGGVISGRQKDINQIRFYGIKFLTGSVLSPHNAFLVLRGIKTLNLRMQQHSASAMKIATYLKNNKHFKNVLYPGLSTHPNHQIAKKQMFNGFGGLISFETNLSHSQTIKFVDALQYFGKAVSLGDPESLISFPSAMSIEANHKTDTFLRISVGLEDPDDLIKDIEQALQKANK